MLTMKAFFTLGQLDELNSETIQNTQGKTKTNEQTGDIGRTNE